MSGQSSHPVDPAAVFTGAAAGLLAGLAASWVMQRFQTHAAPFARHLKESVDSGSSRRYGPKPRADDPQEQHKGEPAAFRATQAVVQAVLHRSIPPDNKTHAAQAAHYAMGGVSGAVYGAAAELTPLVTVGYGSVFGTAVWAIADEAAVPALGLSAPPTRHPPSTHFYSLAAHLVFGLSTELIRRGLRSLR